MEVSASFPLATGRSAGKTLFIEKPWPVHSARIKTLPKVGESFYQSLYYVTVATHNTEEKKYGTEKI